MAIQFARIEIVSRSAGGNACCKGAYNSRSKIKDEKIGAIYNFTNQGDNVYHEIFLPEHADRKFKNTADLMNEVEKAEKRKDSQLLKDGVIALPDDKELTLEDRIEIVNRIIERRGWVKEGLAVQVDIHKPHDGEKNWHAHLLIITRRFTEDGKELGAKARDLNPEFKNSGVKTFIIPEETLLQHDTRDVINEYFAELGLDKRVDAISTVPQEHIGPVRMRSILNQAMERNELRRIAHVESMKDGGSVLDRITRRQAIFSRQDLELAVKDLPDAETRERLIAEALSSDRLIALYRENEGDKGNVAGRAGAEVIEKEIGVGVNTEETGLYTTKEVREEEERIMRLAESIRRQANFTRTPAAALAISQCADLSEVQRGAVEEIVAGEGGVRVLRGRAGSGKSHVLGVANQIAGSVGNHVVGLAPTNKAKEELAGKGFKETHTVKGFLFGLNNGRAFLPKNSLIILDEAGMVANSDLQELLKSCAISKCNLVLAGDERQLTSVERGGLFEIIADKFGSYELAEIRRQSKSWGKEMASLFASGKTKEGVRVLEENGGIRVSSSLEESISDLIKEWGNSSYEIKERLVVTVRNRDVDAINDGIRETLKTNGILTGAGYKIEKEEKIGEHYTLVTREFMEGDRVLFAANNKKLGIDNGTFGTLIKVSKDEFIVRLDIATNKKGSNADKEYKDISFNPAEIEGLRYGYAVTTYKAQGASIKDVYNLHSGVGNSRSSYVNLTRHIDELKLFYNRGDTRSLTSLISQLSRVDERVSSLNFVTEQDLAAKTKELEEGLEQDGVIGVVGQLGVKLGNWIRGKVQEVGDKVHTNTDYYDFEEPVLSMAKVEEVLAGEHGRLRAIEEAAYSRVGIEEASEAREISQINVVESVVEQEMLARSSLSSENLAREEAEEKAMTATAQLGGKVAAQGNGVRTVGAGVGNRASLKQTAKERFYQRADQLRERERFIRDYKAEFESLKHELKFSHERIVISLLGEPNKALSNNSIYRYGKKGSLAVTMRGSRAGTWCDFEAGEGGDMIALVQRETGQDFKASTEYLKSMLGISRHATLRLVDDDRALKQYAEAVAEDSKEQERQRKETEKVKGLYEKAKGIGDRSVAYRYLSEERHISVEPGKDVRTTRIWDKSTSKHYPAIVAFARNAAGEVTGGQTILLDPETATKASVDIVKRSFGKVGGSFVGIQVPAPTATTKHTSPTSERNSITFIAEGLETALSIKEAGIASVGDKILCSLGISNIKNYQPQVGERIMLCADNDGEGAKTNQTTLKARNHLEELGAIVHVIQPKEVGDFNDVLKARGVEGIREQLEPKVAALKQDLGINRIKEKLAGIIEEHQNQNKAVKVVYSTSLQVKDSLPEEAQSFKRAVRSMEKYTVSNMYKLLKVSREDGLKAATEIAENEVERIITKEINNNLKSFDRKEANRLTDFEGKSYNSKLDYLCALAEDKEVMVYLRNSSLHEKVLSAVCEKEDLRLQDEKDLKYVLKSNSSKFDEMATFGVKVNLDKLAETLRPLAEAEREQYVEKLWVGAFRSYAKQHKEKFDKEKLQAVSMEDMLKALEKEKDFCSKSYKDYIEVIVHSGRGDKNKEAGSYNYDYGSYISSNAIAHNKNKHFLNELETHFKMAESLGVTNEQEMIKQIQGADIRKLDEITKNLFSSCQEHLVKQISQDLARLDKHEVIKKDNLELNNHKVYLEHHLNNKGLSPYLKNTLMQSKLEEIHKQEEHQKQLEMQKELEMQKAKTLEKHHEIGGPRL